MLLLYVIMPENHSLSSPLLLRPQPTFSISKSERTRTAILNAALEFIWSHPFRDMTVKSLMVSTGVVRSTFYLYFKDLHEVMLTLLEVLQEEIFTAAEPWITGVGDPVALMHETITELVQISYLRGPIYKAFADTAASDKRFEKAWRDFLAAFDDAACDRIETDQRQGLIPDFDARPVAVVLNRLNAYSLIQAFGQHPRNEQEPVLEALARVWISTLYGSEWLGNDSSSLIRT
jgi:AcrR family transcriptional regulator